MFVIEAGKGRRSWISGIFEDDDRVYFNLYYITQDFEPKIPGSDYMGANKHLHIDNSFLNSYATYGKDLLVRNHMA
ncbi:hypothetical protein [Paenibacillus sp. 22594]|uniref:hypothetical protein n=1 Tax=Paenibacillus sp. 22594 TaxID=3453947 RepID=UPI003F8314C7